MTGGSLQKVNVGTEEELALKRRSWLRTPSPLCCAEPERFLLECHVPGNPLKEKQHRPRARAAYLRRAGNARI
jgi:hypothetical protein